MKKYFTEPEFKLSVIVPCYNDEKYIKDTIDTWLNQSYPIYELIVNDDCSTDQTLQIINEYYADNSKVKVFKNDINVGMAANWNIGIKRATGDFVCNFNADDLVHSDFVSEVMQVYKTYPELSFVTTNYQDLKAGIVISPALNSVRNKLSTGILKGFASMHFNAGIIFSLVFTVYKHSFLISLQKDNNDQLFDVVQTCDAELWTRIGFTNAQGYYLNKYLGYYRKHDNNISSRPWAEFFSSINNMRKHKAAYIESFGRPAYMAKINRQFIPYFKWHIKHLRFPKKDAIISYFKLIF